LITYPLSLGKAFENRIFTSLKCFDIQTVSQVRKEHWGFFVFLFKKRAACSEKLFQEFAWTNFQVAPSFLLNFNNLIPPFGTSFEYQQGIHRVFVVADI
jgi:hypothetical protein